MGDEDGRAIRRRRDRLIALALSGAVGGLAGCGEEANPVPCLSEPIQVEPEPVPVPCLSEAIHPDDEVPDPTPVPCLTPVTPDGPDDDGPPPAEVEPRPVPCLTPRRVDVDERPDEAEPTRPPPPPLPCLSPPREPPPVEP